MKAARMTAFHEPLEIVDIPEPTPGPKDVVVRIEAEGICRSDWHAWNGDWEWVGLSPALPLIPGHELGGVIESVGAEVHEYRVGDRVTAPFHEGCGHCPYCRSARTNLCDNLEFIGFTHDPELALRCERNAGACDGEVQVHRLQNAAINPIGSDHGPAARKRPCVWVTGRVGLKFLA